MSWRCKQCGECCKHIVVPVAESIDLDTEMYLAAHGIAYAEDGNKRKIIIPARCKYLQRIPGTPRKYNCMIHKEKFVNCRLAGKKECENAKEAMKCLQNLR